MGKLKDLVKILTGGGGSPGELIGNMATDYLVGRAVGGKKAGNAAVLGGLAGLGPDDLIMKLLQKGGVKDEESTLVKALSKGLGSSDVKKGPSGMPSLDATVAAIAKDRQKVDPVFKQAEGTLGYAKMLNELGLLKNDNPLLGALNTKAGEAIATMLASGIGSKLFDEEEQIGTGAGSMPFGGSDKRYRIGGSGISRMAAGGDVNGQYFPRRNGGIMPSEGSGQKDDVPAMLMAGEFVLTKDAVKGLGNGDSNRGIERAYKMMDSLERRA